uniref:Uncharacterized protein n=1 Tax=Cacopsylla melanoneura TaxID=428564 RepID=A0A8D8RAZ8_9HEMI
MEDLFSPFGKLLEVVFFAKALIGPKSKCNYAYLTLESAALVQQVLDSRPIYYPKDPTEPKRVKLSIKRKESKPTDGQSSSVKENDKSTESKNTEEKNGAKPNSKSTESKDKKDGSTQTGKFTESKHGSKEAKEKDSGKNEKLPTEGGEFCGFEGMQHVCKELKISGREIYDKLASLSSRSTALEDQVCYVLGLLEKVKFKNQFPVGKNDEVADWLRKKGNKYYNNEGITDECSTKTALDYYSLSLCMANNFSLQIAQAIGNKSACFADLDHPQAVATHIKVVLGQFGDLIPAALEKKLMARMKSVVTRLLPEGAPEWRIRPVWGTILRYRPCQV